MSATIRLPSLLLSPFRRPLGPSIRFPPHPSTYISAHTMFLFSSGPPPPPAKDSPLSRTSRSPTPPAKDSPPPTPAKLPSSSSQPPPPPPDKQHPESQQQPPPPPPKEEPLTMYIVVRRDLQTVLGWPSGSVITQACHASTAILHLARDDPSVSAYVSDLTNMHKLVFEAKHEAHLKKIGGLFRENGMVFHEWIEQPEGLLTCIATKPYRRSEIAAVIKQCRMSLYRSGVA
ncbi:peptidyl-tRNA hydrolase II domain-containing protein [Powellomyces hirtus]|nr:peptidyl-tRNA hydrolase II domain-containing protein [Powellomyces hirtus]